ncbi:unknown function [Klebsiella phage vB_Ko_K66PH128C1]|uniref:Uncharacterized protein n=1 Tax=Klebsiella phage vB_Ko_K66PH128C1 TaxID=3071610 RepID=A0AAD2JUX9_9CAUD|nr:unknown function [Klebsiella phage vB_Ko_K66PH128C1]
MRKLLSYVVLIPALMFLTVGLLLMIPALGIAGGSKGISILTKACNAFATNLKV